MYKLILIDEAKAELLHEANYSKKQWGRLHGQKYFLELQKKIKVLRKNPCLYPIRNDIFPGIRILNYKGNRVIYTLLEKKKIVAILAILSNYQNMNKSELKLRHKEAKAISKNEQN